jgi:hypothetical protein
MNEENTKQRENKAPDVIEDLTPDEAEAENIKGGHKGDHLFIADSFSFGVEREMKE